MNIYHRNAYFFTGPRLEPEPDEVAFFGESSALMEANTRIRQMGATNWCPHSHLYKSVSFVREISSDHGLDLHSQGVIVLLLLLSRFARRDLGNWTR